MILEVSVNSCFFTLPYLGDRIGSRIRNREEAGSDDFLEDPLKSWQSVIFVGFHDESFLCSGFNSLQDC